MQFTTSSRRRPPDNHVPMINVVFLLLVFFLMTAQIAPPTPIDVTPPTATADDPADGTFTLYLGKDGLLAYVNALGTDEALARLQAAKEALCTVERCKEETVSHTLVLRADAAAPGAALAKLMPRIAQIGFARIQLVTVQE